jgi:hypothetical protein
MDLDWGSMVMDRENVTNSHRTAVNDLTVVKSQVVSSGVTAEIDSDREMTIHPEIMVVTQMDSDRVTSAGV